EPPVLLLEVDAAPVLHAHEAAGPEEHRRRDLLGRRQPRVIGPAERHVPLPAREAAGPAVLTIGHVHAHEDTRFEFFGWFGVGRPVSGEAPKNPKWGGAPP